MCLPFSNLNCNRGRDRAASHNQNAGSDLADPAMAGQCGNRIADPHAKQDHCRDEDGRSAEHGDDE